MKKGDIIEDILIEKLVFGGKGFAKLQSDNKDLDGRTLFITGNPIPGSRVNLRVLKKRRDYIETQIHEVVQVSPIEKKHPNNPHGMSGGWKWIDIPYEEQLKIKQNQVKEAFFHIQKLMTPSPLGEGWGEVFEDIQSSPLVDGYRNKVEFSFGKYISHRYEKEEHFNVGFHKQGEFSKIEDFDGCPLIDDFQNKIYIEIKEFCKNSGLPVYDSVTQKGFFRHLVLRRAYFTGEMMIILGFFDVYEGYAKDDIEKIKNFFLELGNRYSDITSIYLSRNSQKADIALGELECIYGKEYITETLHGLDFQISPRSFFQTNSSGAERLYGMVIDFVTPPTPPLSGEENIKDFSNMIVLDLYGGTGTIGMIFAKSGAKKVCSVELVKSASEDGKKNALLNKLENIDFICAKVEDFLSDYLQKGLGADLLVIDPPRAGMHPDALPNILKFGVKQIIYVSCNPATLARDLDYILKNSDYKIQKVGAMDMFPHTAHIETVVSLVK